MKFIELTPVSAKKDGKTNAISFNEKGIVIFEESQDKLIIGIGEGGGNLLIPCNNGTLGTGTAIGNFGLHTKDRLTTKLGDEYSYEMVTNGLVFKETKEQIFECIGEKIYKVK